MFSMLCLHMGSWTSILDLYIVVAVASDAGKDRAQRQSGVHHGQASDILVHLQLSHPLLFHCLMCCSVGSGVIR